MPLLDFQTLGALTLKQTNTTYLNSLYNTHYTMYLYSTNDIKCNDDDDGDESDDDDDDGQKKKIL